MSANGEYEEKASLGAATMSENLGVPPEPAKPLQANVSVSDARDIRAPEPHVDHTFYVPTGGG
jgi:hypothetical protein